jgi:hypothetical protein
LARKALGRSAALDNNATLTSLYLGGNNIGAEFKVARGGPRQQRDAHEPGPSFDQTSALI